MTDLAALFADPAERAKLPAGMRNNNPGNIKFVPGLPYAGLVGPSVNTDQGDPQAVFDTPEHGMAALYQLALKKYEGGKRSADDLIAGQGGWTPGNMVAAGNVARYGGFDPHGDLQLTNPEMAAHFVRGLMQQEHGDASKLYTDAMIQSAITGKPGAPTPQMAQAGPAAPAVDLAAMFQPMAQAAAPVAPRAYDDSAFQSGPTRVAYTPPGPTAAPGQNPLGQLGDMLARQRQQIVVG